MARLTALATALGAVVAALYGTSMGTAAQSALVAVAGLVSAVSVYSHHANQRALTQASVQVGAHQVIADAVAGAVHHALGVALATRETVGATPGAPGSTIPS